MTAFFFPVLMAWTVAGVFALSGLVHLAAPGFVRRAYARWGFPPKFYRVAAGVDLLAAAFLANPITRIWGIALAGLVTFVGVIILLKNREYAWSLPGTLLLIALVPASLSATF
ncbi:MAG TPA: DoxX family protein [Rhizomicrobium sp.]